MSGYIDLKEQNFCFLGKDSQIEGTFRLKGHAYISSHIEGKLLMEKDTNLVIETGGYFKGDINCTHIEVAGEIEGDIQSAGKAIFHSSASFKGNIQAKTLVIHPGAKINMQADTQDN